MNSSEKMQLSQSQEDYLESIYVLTRDEGVARSKDISKRLNVNTSSVTGALKTLSSMDLVNYEPYGNVTLTEQGNKIACKVACRHRMLHRFFEDVLGLDHEQSDIAACYMEHSGSDIAVERLGLFAEFMKSTGSDGQKLLISFKEYCRHNHMDCSSEVKS